MATDTVLITGGTSGIGMATAILLHERGARVMVTGSGERSVAAARTALPSAVEAVVADSASLADTDRLMTRVAEQFGTLTGLFLNAGITRGMPIEAMTEAVYDELFAVNAKGQFFTLQKALPLLDDGSSVVMTVGIGATRGVPGGAATAGSRGALLTMMPSLALELAPRRIRVNAVSPGAVDTPIWAKSGLPEDVRAAAVEATAKAIPFQRLGDAREVATTAAFLLSEDAAYITGQDIVVAGGGGLSA